MRQGCKMQLLCLVLALCVCAESAVQNVTCPVIAPMEIDLKEVSINAKESREVENVVSKIVVKCIYGSLDEEKINLDGRWYLQAAATELQLSGYCAMVVFNHKSDNSTDVSISWLMNNTASYYNGSVELTVDPRNNGTGDLLYVTYTDQKSEMYSFLVVDYEHYAVIFGCTNNSDGNSSTYELWELTRSPHVKDDAAAKLNQAITSYGLQNTPFMMFNNTEDTCRTNNGGHLQPSLVMTSAAAISLFRRLY